MAGVLCSLLLALVWSGYEIWSTRARHAKELETRDKSLETERARHTAEVTALNETIERERIIHAKELEARDNTIERERLIQAKEQDARDKERVQNTLEIQNLNAKIVSQHEHHLAEMKAIEQAAFARGLAAGAGEISIRWAQQEDETGVIFKSVQRLQLGVVIYRGKVLFAFGDLAQIDRFQISDELKKAILGAIEAVKGISAGVSHILPLVA